MKWFGKAWAAACTPETHTETPVGRACICCNRPIGPDDRGIITGPPEAVFHHACWLKHLGLDRFPDGYGANYRRPVIRIRWAALALDDPEESRFRAVCPVCGLGVLRVQRDPATYRLTRADFCSRCVQRFEYTDLEIAGEPLPGIGDA